MQITLRIGEEDKTFTNNFVEAIIFRNALKLNKEIREKGMDPSDPEQYDRIIEFVTTAFNNQFTIDEVWKGLSTDKLQSETVRIFNEVLELGGLATFTETGEVNVDVEGK